MTDIVHTPLHLDWPDCRNARDLGGMPTADGARIRERALIRTDSHSRLTAEGQAAIRSYGVSRVLDLRRPAECAMLPSPLAGTSLYQNLSVHPEGAQPGTTLEDMYREMLDERPDLFASAMAAIASAPPGGVVVHCFAGQDRTGLVVAFALHLAGVASDVIALDYAVTQERLRDTYAELLAISDPGIHDWLRTLYRTPPEAMHTVFEHVQQTYGGVIAYLESGGLRTSQIDAVRSRLRTA